MNLMKPACVIQPKQEINLDTEKTIKVMNAIESLEELDDVQDVYSNLEISEEALASLEEM